MIALRAKGETVEELVGFAYTMRDHAIKTSIEDPDAIDMCSTGADGSGFNISTVASFVAAGAGVTVRSMAIALSQVNAAVGCTHGAGCERSVLG